jgi:hypothetical protein
MILKGLREPEVTSIPRRMNDIYGQQNAFELCLSQN